MKVFFSARWWSENHGLFLSSSSVKAFNYCLLSFGVLCVGLIDYITGSEIHVISLYFVPLAFAGWRLGQIGAIVASLLSTVAWILALYKTTESVAQPLILAFNFLTQGVAFLTVSLVFARLALALKNEKLLSWTDPLTGLNNRRAFIEQANAALAICRRHSRPVSLAYIDLDNFKHVNDLLGHAQGDALLRNCARMITDCLRTSDIAARLGGDEFVILLLETNAESAEVLLERLRLTLGMSIDFRAAGVTASIGIIVDNIARASINELLKQADAQMYGVKRDSKNRVAIRPLTEE